MSLYDVLDQVVALLKSRGRVTYRALKREFNLDDNFIEVLKEEILYVHPVIDDEGRGLIWTGETEATLVTDRKPNPPEPQPVVEQTQPVQDTSSPVEAHTPDAERRQLTVMFCDLVDSTALSGQLDAEDYREVVREYQTTCGAVIERFDCHIAQTLGDGLLIYSGYPVAHENDAERAVRVGLGILDAMKALNERLEQEKQIRLGVRVGIHTGTVVVGDVGAGTRQEQLALGEVPNVASRMEGLAEPDTVVISNATYRLVEGYFDFETIGERELRGVTEPIVVYRVLGDSGIQSRLEIASTRGLTPLVGRESEVTLLLDRWEQAKSGNGQVVLLSGEAGIGKSRLVQVIKDHVADEPHTRLECRSSSYFTNSALYPITDFLQRALQFQSDNTPEQKLEKLEQNLSQYRLPLEESVPLFASLLSLPVPENRYPPLNLSPQRQRQRTLESIVAIILELSEQQPVLFILEDLHWTDPTTLEFLDLLIAQIPTASVGALLTCRPEFQPSWQHHSYLTEMTLNRLSRHQIARMAEHVAGERRLPDEIVQQLVDKSDGVPLFVEEMTKAVVESAILKETNGHYELVGSVASLSIPATLQDSLMARLDRLVTAKAVAQYASVIGRQFSYELLQTVSELDQATLQRELSRLVAAELLYQRGLPPEVTYLFKHALIQDAAYQSLLKSTRQQYHQRIVHVLEGRFSQTVEMQPELLAHHCTQAGLIEQAVDYWYQAGQRAIKRSANMEAIAHLSKGLDLLEVLPDTPQRTQRQVMLHIVLGNPLIVTKGYASPEVERVYTRAWQICQHVEDVEETPQFVWVLCGLRKFYFHRGQVQIARELAERSLVLAQNGSDQVMLLGAHMGLGATLYSPGELVNAHAHLETSLTLYQPERDQLYTALYGIDLGVNARSHTVRVLWLLGYPDQALQRSREALHLAKELSHPYSQAFALYFTSVAHCFCREGQMVHEHTEALIALATEQGFPFFVALATMLQGWALATQGQAAEGIVQIRQGLAALRVTGEELEQLWLLALLVEACEKVGEVEEGLRVLETTLARLDKTGERYYEAELHRLKGELLLQQSSDNHPEAETCFHKALDVARQQQAKALELRAATSLARLWQSQEKREEARELLEPVYSWFTEGFDTADLIDAKTLLDELS